MRPRSSAILALLVCTAAAWAAPSRVALAQATLPTPSPHEIPQSLRLEHEENVAQLTLLATHKGPVGVAARNAMAMYKRHVAREDEYIFPPLTLLPLLVDGHVRPDMAWAVEMADRIKADREVIFQEHTQITDAMNNILEAANKAHDKAAADFASAAVADSLNDAELQEPMSLLIGDFIRMKLAAAGSKQ
jgi:hypothetical protein